MHPVGAEGFEDTTVSGTATTFTDVTFMSKVYSGFLFVEDISASTLRASDFLGKSDPYIVMSVGSSSARTTIKKQELNPVYKGERKCLYVEDPEKALLKIRVYDEDLVGSDDDLGYLMFPLAKLTDLEDSYILDEKLEGKDAGEGRVKMRITYVPMYAFTPEAREKMVAMEKAMPPEQTTEMSKEAPMLMQTMVRGTQMKRLAKKGDIRAAAQSQMEEMQNAIGQGIKDFMKKTGQVPPVEQFNSPWAVLAEQVAETCAGLEPRAFVENHQSDTQVWLYSDEARKVAVIAFRGTEQVKWKDLATDLNLVPTSLNAERIDDDKGASLVERLVKSAFETADKLKVHSGFLFAYDSVRQTVVKLLDAITGTGDNGKWQVLVTGHSLGGALATLCAYDLAKRQGPVKQAQSVAMYTYGAPRVGNVKFVEEFNALVPDSWRITNKNDIVPTVPRMLGYAHVRHSVSLEEDGTLLIQDDAGDVFGEGRAGADVLKELVDRVASNESSLSDVIDEISAHEMEIFNNLVGGDALEQHMEDFYLETLRACVFARIKATATSDGSNADGDK